MLCRRSSSSRTAGSALSFRLLEQGTHREVERIGELLDGDDGSGDATALHETHVGPMEARRGSEGLLRIICLRAKTSDGTSQLLLDGEHDPTTVSRHRLQLYSISSG